ncbi:MAG: hypothetical protein HC834_02720 [Rhodospirillales bacterium]|nr:hypothetical protein [Rhodospirillales bacterium]
MKRIDNVVVMRGVNGDSLDAAPNRIIACIERAIAICLDRPRDPVGPFDDFRQAQEYRWRASA